MSRTTLMIGLLVVLTGCVAAGNQRPNAERVPLAPYDDACDRADLCRFREELLVIIEARDAKALLARLSKAFNATGALHGRTEFETALANRESVTWKQLKRTLSLGGSLFQDTPRPRFCAPYGSTRYPDPSVLLNQAKSDGDAWVVTAPSAPVHAKPDATSPVQGEAGYELIALTGASRVWWKDAGADEEWIQVLHAGATGYIQRKHLWSPDDPQLCMALEDGEWRITKFMDANGHLR